MVILSYRFMDYSITTFYILWRIMKTRQFIVLLIAIFLQPIICYIMFWYLSQYIRYDLAEVASDTSRMKYRLETITQDIQLTNDHIANVYDWLKK